MKTNIRLDFANTRIGVSRFFSTEKEAIQRAKEIYAAGTWCQVVHIGHDGIALRIW